MENTITGTDPQTHETLEHIAQSLRDAGYDPYGQMIGYLKTGDMAYITRKGDARTQIQTIPLEQVQQYAESFLRPDRT